MAGGNDSQFNALYDIYCSSVTIAGNAGGTAVEWPLANEEDILQAIVCNFGAAVTGLGGTPCYGGDDYDGLWLSFLYLSSALATATGTGSNGGASNTVDGMMAGVLCNLIQVSENTGTELIIPA